VIAETPRPLPPVVMADPPARPRAPRLVTVGALQAELGIRADRRLDEYGPMSTLSETMLFDGYRHMAADEEEQ